MIPQIINRLEQPEQAIRFERYREFQEITYPLSALEISEMIDVPANTIMNYRAGRTIKNYIFGLISKTKIRHFVDNKIVVRKDAHGKKKNIPLRKIVIKRLQKDSRGLNTDLANKAIEMLKKLGMV